MVNTIHKSIKKNIGFVATRIKGTDGVSLEIKKWSHVLGELGCKCFYFGGELDTPKNKSHFCEKAYFLKKDIKQMHNRFFDNKKRSPSDTKKIKNLSNHIKENLYEFINKYNIDLIIPENTLAIPVHIPLGIAITELIAETGIPVIAHHHDFFWERKRFLYNCVWDYLNMSFPPHLPSMQHVVINSSGDNQLSLRTGISAILIPNVMNFERPPQKPDLYTKDILNDLGIEKDEFFILQPTRVVQRKGIEHAIELVSRLNKKAKLVISHASGDEGYLYEQRVKEYSRKMKVNTIFVSDIIGEDRGLTKDGRKIYTLYDVYPYADLVTYPSTFEGFGNAFLEAVYFKKPIVVNNYSVFSTDIKPKNFKVIHFDEFITNDTVKETLNILNNKEAAREMCEHNYEVAQKYYSYSVLKEKLFNILIDFFGV